MEEYRQDVHCEIQFRIREPKSPVSRKDTEETRENLAKAACPKIESFFQCDEAFEINAEEIMVIRRLEKLDYTVRNAVEKIRRASVAEAAEVMEKEMQFIDRKQEETLQYIADLRSHKPESEAQQQKDYWLDHSRKWWSGITVTAHYESISEEEGAIVIDFHGCVVHELEEDEILDFEDDYSYQFERNVKDCAIALGLYDFSGYRKIDNNIFAEPIE